MSTSQTINRRQWLASLNQSTPRLSRRILPALVLLFLCSLTLRSQAQYLYVVDSLADKLYTISTSTGSSTAIVSGLSWPVGLAVDGGGNLFISNNGSGATASPANTITEYSAAGVVSTFATGLSSPTDMAYDTNGNLYVRNEGSGTITKVTSSGVESTFVSGLSSYDTNSPTGMVFDSHGNMYVASGTSSSNQSIIEISSSGVKSVYSSNTANGGLLNNPGAIAFSSGGYLFVANSNAHNIIEIAPNGTQSVFATLSSSYNPSGVTFDSKGNLYVGTYGNASNNWVGNIYEYANGVTSANPILVGSGLPYDVLALDTNPVPEPGGALLIFIGGILFILQRRRQRD